MATGGSLGQGLAIALGRAYAKKLNGKGNVYCLIGDGELQEGMIWESLNIANRLGVNNLVIMVDYNKYQAITSVEEVMGETYDSIKNKLEAFGCVTTTVDGHDNDSMKDILNLKDGLNAVILKTQKGKGIPFLEKNPSFHVIYMHERPEVLKEALEALK